MRLKHLFLFGIILLLSACQKEETITQPVEHLPSSNYEVQIVSHEAVPHIMGHLSSELADDNTQSLKGYKLKLPFNKNRIIEEKINQIKDPETGVTTFTFAIEKKKNESEVYNLVLTENPDGSFQRIFLLRFDFSDEFNKSYNNGEVTLADFKGEITYYFAYSDDAEEKGIYDLEPCTTYEYEDPYGDPYGGDCTSCGSSGGPGAPGGSVAGGTYKCVYNITRIEVTGACSDCPSGYGTSVVIADGWECGYTSENLSGFEHCEDPNPVGPNDPYIDLSYHIEVVNNWEQTVNTNHFYMFSIDELVKDEGFQSLVSQYVPKVSNSISDSDWAVISAQVYKGAYNSLSASADQHKLAMSKFCEWKWWEQIQEVGRKFEEAYNASLDYLPQNSAEWGDMATAFMHFLPEILAEFNPVTAAAVALKDAWLNFDEGKYVVGGLYVAAAIAEFVPWAQVFNKITDLAKIGIKGFKYFRPFNLFSGYKILQKSEKALDYANKLRKGPLLGSSVTPDYRFVFKSNTIDDIYDLVGEVHHAIPQKVYDNYDGIITRQQLHSLENLRGIPKNLPAPDFHDEITDRWRIWFNNNADFDLDDALGFAKTIDDEFGHRFIPPIR